MAEQSETYKRHAWRLHRVMKRLAELCDGSRHCEFSDCRRARRCVDLSRECVFKADTNEPMTDSQVSEWNALAMERQQCLALLKSRATNRGKDAGNRRHDATCKPPARSYVT